LAKGSCFNRPPSPGPLHRNRGRTAFAGIDYTSRTTDPKFKVDDINILDPCAGEAKALAQLAGGLSISPSHIYAVELNVRRAAIIAEAHPQIRLLGPCSFKATRITKHSFSLVYLNPPFDDEFGGGGREEPTFLRRAIDPLVPGGIHVLVCPVHEISKRPKTKADTAKRLTPQSPKG
jgi:hypothetical protein